MLKQKLVKKIPIHPKNIGQDLKLCILNKIKKYYDNKCCSTIGYVINIDPEIKILDNNLYSSTNFVNFKIEINVETIKPVVGLCIDVNVLKILEVGVLCEMNGVMKIFIPAKQMGQTKFSNVTSTFKGNDIEIKEGNNINVEISNVRYVDNTFKCIGTFNKIVTSQVKAVLKK